MAFGRITTALCVAACMLALSPASIAKPSKGSADSNVPRYEHIFVIINENKNFSQILNQSAAPHIVALAKTYGNATQFFAEVHPSEANYVALLAGDTFGIHDDDAYYCRAKSTRPLCDGADAPGYVDHTIGVPFLGTQLEAKGLTWKGYYESIPESGSDAVIYSGPRIAELTRKTALYASKHSGFMNFATVQSDPRRASRIVGFDQLDTDIANGTLPAFALIIPNQCNDMHGLHGEGVQADCDGGNVPALIRRGDAANGALVAKLMRSAAWRSRRNVAIVLTFDEGAGKTREGCCGITPGQPSNFGGGHIPTIIITNHGPRGVADDTPYSHYSLLRTMEDAFGISDYLGHAGDGANGVRPMVPLFAVSQFHRAL